MRRHARHFREPSIESEQRSVRAMLEPPGPRNLYGQTDEMRWRASMLGQLSIKSEDDFARVVSSLRNEYGEMGTVYGQPGLSSAIHYKVIVRASNDRSLIRPNVRLYSQHQYIYKVNFPCPSRDITSHNFSWFSHSTRSRHRIRGCEPSDWDRAVVLFGRFFSAITIK